jgi:predicted MPP superfamily phosphohydrolase
MAVTDLWLVPVYDRQGGDVLSMIIGLVRALELPGLLIAETATPRFQHHLGWGRWLVMIGSSFPIYVLIPAWLRRGWRSRTPRKAPAVTVTDSQNAPAGAPQVAPTRRDLLLGTRRIVIAGAAGVAGYSLFGEIRRPETTYRSILIRDLPRPLHGLRIVQLTDIHHGPWTSLAYVRDVIAQANALQPDLMILTGDYVHQSAVYIEPVVRELTALRGKIGVLATLGNHDWWEDGQATIRAFAKTSIPLIDNDRVFITGERTIERQIGSSDEKSALCIAGVGDLWEGPPLYGPALGGVPPAMPRLLLSHNPDVAEEPPLLKLNPRIDLMLSGHTHGGQISFPFFGPVVTPSKYGKRYASGLVQGPICPVYISRGIGTTIVPMRMRVRPEIAVIELRQA